MSRVLTGAITAAALLLLIDDLRLRDANAALEAEREAALQAIEEAEARSAEARRAPRGRSRHAEQGRVGAGEEETLDDGRAEEPSDEQVDDPPDERMEARREEWTRRRKEELREDLDAFIEERGLDTETGDQLTLLVEASMDDMMVVWQDARAARGARMELSEELEAIILGLEEDVDQLLNEEDAAAFQERFGPPVPLR